MNRNELLKIAKPILFNTEMVKAILDGRKTVTRRVVKPQPSLITQNPLGWITGGTTTKDLGSFAWGQDEYGGMIDYAKPKYHIGDILYVRETWVKLDNEIMYKADDEIPEGWHLTAWKPSIHMPKSAARIFLRVTDVRVERLQDIKADDLRKEGLTSMAVHCGDMSIALEEWAILWNSTIKKADLDTYGWEANPYVWVFEFERVNNNENNNN